MKKNFVYLSKIESNSYNLLKAGKNGLSIQFRMKGWIKFLSEDENFDEWANKFLSDSNDKERGYLNFPLVGKDIIPIKLILDKDEWNRFQENCKRENVSANYIINLLVRQYNETGDLFEIKLSV